MNLGQNDVPVIPPEVFENLETESDSVLSTKELTTKDKLDALLTLQKQEGLGVSNSMKLRTLRKQIKQETEQAQSIQKYIQNTYVKPQQKQFKRLMSQVRVMETIIGKVNMKSLKDLYTVPVAEKKNDKGEVIVAASSYVNYPGLLVEAQYVIVLEREARIQAGQRKRSTGRSSKRQAHAASVQFIHKRNEVASKETPAK